MDTGPVLTRKRALTGMFPKLRRTAAKMPLQHSGQGSTIRTTLSRALHPTVVITSLQVAFVVGTILNIINNGDSLVDNSQFPLGKVMLNYTVPYLVATYSAVRVSG